MTKIISTVGPISSNNNQKFLVKSSGMIRFNMSHNSPKWHKKNIDIIKKLDPKKKYFGRYTWSKAKNIK